MRSLADAWDWYEATKRNLSRMQRLGDKHWKNLARSDISIWQDDQFKMLEAREIVNETLICLKPIDDLAVVVLFSVFESLVRDYLIERIKPQAGRITDPILKEAADDAMQGVEQGSFSNQVLEPLKKQRHVSADLVEQVKQVRDYRNWVAHGRRDAATNNVTPVTAYKRLNDFLAALGIAAESEKKQPDQLRAEHE